MAHRLLGDPGPIPVTTPPSDPRRLAPRKGLCDGIEEKGAFQLVAGHGEPNDIDLLENICSHMVGNTICPMGEAAVNPVLSTLKHFRHEYQYYLDHKKPMTAA